MEHQKPNDIVPELYEQTMKRFHTAIATDPWIKSFQKRLRKGTATQEDAQTYAEKLGEHAAAALTSAFQVGNLPDGKIYYNIAKRLIEPILREIHDLVNDAMVSIIEIMHKKKRIGVKPQRAEFNQDRCDAIINKIVAVSVGETDGE